VHDQKISTTNTKGDFELSKKVSGVDGNVEDKKEVHGGAATSKGNGCPRPILGLGACSERLREGSLKCSPRRNEIKPMAAYRKPPVGLVDRQLLNVSEKERTKASAKGKMRRVYPLKIARGQERKRHMPTRIYRSGCACLKDREPSERVSIEPAPCSGRCKPKTQELSRNLRSLPKTPSNPSAYATGRNSSWCSRHGRGKTKRLGS